MCVELSDILSGKVTRLERKVVLWQYLGNSMGKVYLEEVNGREGGMGKEGKKNLPGEG